MVGSEEVCVNNVEGADEEMTNGSCVGPTGFTVGTGDLSAAGISTFATSGTVPGPLNGGLLPGVTPHTAARNSSVHPGTCPVHPKGHESGDKVAEPSAGV